VELGQSFEVVDRGDLPTAYGLGHTFSSVARGDTDRMSAQEQHWQDDEERNRRQEPGEHTDPNRPPRTGGTQRERRPADKTDEEIEQSRADPAQRRHEGALEDGSELPG
jgi:hypothetical protein